MASTVPASGAEPGVKPRRASPKVLVIPAVAASLALALWWSTPRLGALAPYEVDVVDPAGAGQSALQPGAASPRLELAPGHGLTLLFRPRGTNTEPVEASAFLEGAAAGAPLVSLDGDSEVLPAGVLRLTLRGAPLPEAGRLRVLIGRSGTLPRVPAGTATHGRDWQRFDFSFIQPAPTAP